MGLKITSYLGLNDGEVMEDRAKTGGVKDEIRVAEERAGGRDMKVARKTAY